MADDKTTPVADTKPDWLKKTEMLQDLVAKGQGVQVAWRSGTNDPCCVPILLTEKMQTSSMPISVEEPPETMASPKREWFGSNLGWYDNDKAAQGMRLTAVEQTVDDLKQAHDDAVKANKQSDTKLDNLTKLVAATNTAVGKITTAVNQLTVVANKLQSQTTQSQTKGDADK